jgi:predicted acylesterase/phospholipase RssA
MSTSSIPFIFPPRKYNNTLYVDGGLISNEIINQATGELPCDFYNITFVSSSSKSQKTPEITGLFSYISTVVHVLFRTFDYQLAQINRCAYPKGQINACFPTSPELDKYSILDFNNGAILYELGMEANKCITYELC